MNKCIDCGKPFDPQNPKSSLVRGPVCHQKALDTWDMPDEVHKIAEIIKKEKFSVFLVGGSIRDFLMGRKIKDYDLVTNAKTKDLEKMFPHSLEVGKQFGVVKVPIKDDLVEIATFREDGVYSDGRRPDYIKEGTLETDVQRRDFTINGLLFDVTNKNIIDQVGGMDDIRNQCVRCIGNPAERFKEDYLRILRAIRFSTVLNFSIEPKTYEAIKVDASNLQYMAKERVLQELDKVFSSENLQSKVELLRNTKVLNYCYDSLSNEEHDQVLNKIAATKEPLNKHIIYSWYFKNDAKTMNSKYKITLNDSKVASQYYNLEQNLINYKSLSKASQNKLLSDELFDSARKFSFTKEQDLISKNLVELQKNPLNKSLLTSGKELMEYGVSPGKDIGIIIAELENKVYSREISTEEEKDNFIRQRILK